VTGTRITYHGLHNIPSVGGAVVAINHTSYVDFLPAALAVMKRKRRLRYMIKAEMQDVLAIDFLIRHTKTIPVDRRAGAGAYAMAIHRLREGELVGVYPEATISRSFEIKGFKSGAARMALEADVPIIPVIVWGAQRIATKGRPKHLGRTRTPVMVSIGEPIAATGTAEELTAQVREVMQTMLLDVQQDYGPHPAGEDWVPARLGGSAPTLAEADELDRRAREDT
jgi:1-acyl-sn-glycerol-3-phosphate acyltransferase